MISENTYSTYDNLSHIYFGNFTKLYDKWDTPTTIISDGPYGIGGYDGDPKSPTKLGEVYEPFIKIWSEAATPATTLWFWNTELGWANVHPVLEKYGWEFVNCHIWNKGKAHVAGNANTKTLRKLPVVTEVCVQYVKKPQFKTSEGIKTMQEWLRYEWQRTGFPLSKTNEVCGVKNAATRKYFTKCNLWYYPPVDAFEKLSNFANEFGRDDEKPFFSINGKSPITPDEWNLMRAKFKCPFGYTNVWDYPPLNGKERLKNGSKSLHLNQKPLKLMQLILEMSTEKGDVIWEPFGGLCSAVVSANTIKRKGFAAEIRKTVYEQAVKRLQHKEMQPTLGL
ncbi:MAG: DNA methyltransferase [Bacteroidota bacterium]